ncbi:hypothetical protein Leryth_007171 [Lithospermum erythrorhizon]|nr:hypothetical protein Leryth_007171 [Lithospermum erythrorhizon]
MDSILSYILNNLTLVIRQESSLLGGLKGDLQSIKDELEQMQAFLKRAEFLIENDSGLKAWVGQVRHEIAFEIQEIKNRINSISEIHKRYQAQYGGSTGSSSYIMRNALYDRRGDVLLLEESDLVGIEDSKSELKGMLLSDDVRRNVISVVDVQDLDLDGLKQLILESLQSEKYLVVYDDVWSQADWDAIHLAFPRNKCGSRRVLITTRNSELSQAASNTEDGGFVYPLKPLREKEARGLFCKTTFGDSTSCPQHLTRACQNILRACEGLTLAIVVMGSTLATKSRRTEEWELFYRSIGEVYESNTKMNVMMKLLSLSYYDLPNHLRICLLYLSIFPEDAFIEKMRLFRLWTAEGLVQQIQGMTIEEVAEGYLYELLKRSLVLVAEFCTDGRVKSVRVHDIVLLIILLKANEQNIATIINP